MHVVSRTNKHLKSNDVSEPVCRHFPRSRVNRNDIFVWQGDMDSISFTPSLAQDLRENAVVGLGLLIFVPVIVYFMRAGISLQYAVVSGIAGAFLMFIFYTGRFLFFAPKRVECSDTG